MLVVAVVLGREQRVDHRRRHRREPERHAVLPVEHGEDLAPVVGEHAALGQLGAERQVAREVLPGVDRLTSGVRRRQHQRRGESRDERADQRRQAEQTWEAREPTPT